ncbi:MAG: DUF4178 domain-containing protein [Myxococcota bacterium]
MSVLSCPNCGAVHERRNPGIQVIVCDRCDSTIYDRDGVLALGERSVVAEPQSDIVVGANGRIANLSVEVIGRIQLEYPGGAWDEWYVRDAEGRDLWLVEDERRYALEWPIEPPPAITPDLMIGDQLPLGDALYEVRETGPGRVTGGEGQLPRNFRPGEDIRYVDLAEVDGPRMLLVEFGDDGAEAFAGRAIDVEQIVFPPRPDRPVDAAPTAAALECANCGSNLVLPHQGERAVQITCRNCDSVLELDEAGRSVVRGKVAKTRFMLELGDEGTIEGMKGEVIARLKWRDPEGYVTQEFLLYCPDHGYVYLELDNGHLCYSRPIDRGPPLRDLQRAHYGDVIKHDGREFKLRAKGRQMLTYVDGALPYACEVGEVVASYDLSEPPHYLSVEIDRREDGAEVEIFQGQWLPRDKDVVDFGDKPLTEWDQHTVHAAQPNPWVGRAGYVVGAALIAFFNLLVVVATFGSTGQELTTFTIPASATGERSVVSPPFEITESGGDVLVVKYAAPQVSNSWVWIDLDWVDANGEVPVGYLGREVGYYSGVEGGESWSEGNRRSTKYLAAPPPGTYALEASLEYDRPVSVDVVVTQGAYMSRYHLLVMLAFGILAAGMAFAWMGFEAKRKEEA